MEDRRTMSLALAQGELRQLLLEEGSTLLVVSGRLAVTSPPLWVAESMMSPRRVVEPEAVWIAEPGGWVELQALQATQLVVIAPGSVSLWRAVGRCLEGLVGLGRPADRVSKAH